MTRAWAVMMVAFATSARGDDVSTAELLGDEATWDRARVELRDVHGLWGGHDVRVDGAGRVIVRVVDEAQRERRFETTIPPAEARAVLRAAVEGDVLRAAVPQRRGLPDEARPRLVLVNARGLDRGIDKWERDPVPAFDRVRAALLELANAVAARERPTHEGAYDRAWRPAGTVVVHASKYSGREDPRWELTPDELATLRDKLRDLPPLGAPRAVQGLRGFTFQAHGVEGVPAYGWVQGGVVALTNRDGGAGPIREEQRKDAHGLLEWLTERARERGMAPNP